MGKACRPDRVQIAFESASLRAICESEAQAAAELSPTIARALKNRLADMDAASYATDLIAGTPRQLAGADHGCMAVALADGLEIVFCSNHPRPPLTETGHVDWARVSRVRIMRIGR